MFKISKIEHGVSVVSSVSVCLKNVGRHLVFLIGRSEIVCVTDPVTESGGADTSNPHPAAGTYTLHPAADTYNLHPAADTSNLHAAGHGLCHSCVKSLISFISIYIL